MGDEVFQKTAEDNVPHRGVLRPRDFKEGFTFARYPAPNDLAVYVDYIWMVRWDFPDNKVRQSPAVLPNPQINLYCSSDEGAGIQGIFKRVRTYTASGKGGVAGVAFKPGGFFAFWPYAASGLTDKNVAIDEVFPGASNKDTVVLLQQSDDDICRWLETVLHAKQPVADPNIVLVQQILSRIQQDPDLDNVASVARAFAKSERAVQQLFQTYVGVGVKWVLLRNRLLLAVDASSKSLNQDWATMAAELGYASQAHFITDFKRVTGMTPGAYTKMQA